MKKSYKIFSVYLDNKPIHKEVQTLSIDENETLYEVGSPYNLMDEIFGYKRVIDAEILITTESETELVDLFKNNLCPVILIRTNINYENHKIINSFYTKRILQTISLLDSYYPNYSFFFLKTVKKSGC